MNQSTGFMAVLWGIAGFLYIIASINESIKERRFREDIRNKLKGMNIEEFKKFIDEL
jgi:hypothetical protein